MSSDTTGYGFTGERWGAYAQLLSLRARYYQPGTGRFINKDPWGGSIVRPATLNGFNYVNSNPVRFVDLLGLCDYDPYDPYYDYDCWTLAATVAQLIGEPSEVVGESSYDSLYLAYNGPNYSTTETPDGGRGQFDRTSVRSILRLKKALLSSAKRHNKIPGMDNNGFAALIAAILRNERRIGNYPPPGDMRDKGRQRLENYAVFGGCLVSGEYLEPAYYKGTGGEGWEAFLSWDVTSQFLSKSGDWSDFWMYWDNDKIPEYATVGIGNIGVTTAADLWMGQWEIEPLRAVNVLGWEFDLTNPFAPETVCTAFYGCATSGSPPSKMESYQTLAGQLLQNNISVEYVAGNLEYGALRAMSKGLTPSAFNSVTWHMAGVQTKAEIGAIPAVIGGAIWTVDQIPTALEILGLTSMWNLSMEPQYVYYRWQQSR
jgi:RHS repeat-associated protein